MVWLRGTVRIDERFHSGVSLTSAIVTHGYCNFLTPLPLKFEHKIKIQG